MSSVPRNPNVSDEEYAQNMKAISAGRQHIRDTHIITPSAFQITDNWRFVNLKIAVEKGSAVPTVFGVIHDAVAGPIANVEYARDTLVVESLSGRQGWARDYNPNQPLEDQIALVAIIALKGENIG